jgi:hypothetical protein
LREGTLKRKGGERREEGGGRKEEGGRRKEEGGSPFSKRGEREEWTCVLSSMPASICPMGAAYLNK